MLLTYVLKFNSGSSRPSRSQTVRERTKLSINEMLAMTRRNTVLSLESISETRHPYFENIRKNYGLPVQPEVGISLAIF